MYRARFTLHKVGRWNCLRPGSDPLNASFAGLAVVMVIACEVLSEIFEPQKRIRELPWSLAGKARRRCNMKVSRSSLRVKNSRRAKGIYFTARPSGIARQPWPGITYFLSRPNWARYSDFDTGRIEEMQVRTIRSAQFSPVCLRATSIESSRSIRYGIA